MVLDQSLLQGLEAVFDIGQARSSTRSTVLEAAVLSEQVDDAHPEAAPLPESPGLGVSLMGEVAVVLVHDRPAFAQSPRQALVERVIRRDAMRDGLGLRE